MNYLLKKQIFFIVLFISVCDLKSQVNIENELDNLRKETYPTIQVQAIKKIANYVKEIEKDENKKKDIIELIKNQLNNPETEVKIAVIESLKYLEDKNSIPFLINALSNSSSDICSKIRKVLIEFKNYEILKESLLKHPNSQVRQQMAILFGELGDKAFIPDLIKALKDNDFVRYSVVEAFSKIKDPVVKPYLIKLLNDPVGEIRVLSANILSEFKFYDTLDYVINLIDDNDPFVSKEIRNVLDKFIVPETFYNFIDYLLESKSVNVRIYSAGVFIKYQDKVILPLLFEAELREKNSTVRKKILETIDSLVDKNYILNLCLLLNIQDTEIKKATIEIIKRLSSPQAVMFLLKRLTQETQPELVEIIHKTIVDITDKSIIDYLLYNLKNKNEPTQQKICVLDAIDKLNAVELSSELLEIFKKEKIHILRIKILQVLKNIADKSLLPELHKLLLEEKDIEIKINIVYIIQKINDPSSITIMLECFKYGDELLNIEIETFLNKIASEKNIQFFLEGIKSKNLTTRMYAIKIMKKYPLKIIQPYVLIAINDKDPLIRKDAAELLGIIGDSSVIDILGEKITRDKDEDVRIEAIKSIQQIGNVSIVKFVIKALKDKSPVVKLEAIKILELYGDKSIIPDVLKTLKKEQDSTVKSKLIYLLGKYGDKSLVKILVKYLDVSDSEIRKSAIEVLGDLGDITIIPKLKEIFKNDTSDDVKISCIFALSKFHTREMIPAFMELISSNNKNIKEAARTALNNLINENDFDYMIVCLQSENKEIKNYASTVLSKMKSNENVKKLFEIFKKSDGDYKLQLMKVISNANNETFIDNFITLIENPLHNNNVELHKWVIDNLSKFKSEKVIDYLIYLLKHNNEVIREYAVIALKNINSDDKKIKEILNYVAEKDTSFSVRRAAGGLLKY